MSEQLIKIELCPICIDNPATYYTECGHCYCIGCLSCIKKCSMCRKILLRANLCIEIKSNTKYKTTEPEQHDHTYLNLIDIDVAMPNYFILRIMSGMGRLTYST